MLSARTLLRRRSGRSSRRPVLVLLAVVALISAAGYLVRRRSTSTEDAHGLGGSVSPASPDEFDSEDDLAGDELYESDQFLDAE